MAFTGADIVASAEKYKGVPYFEGNPQGTPAEGKLGFDCSGIVQRAMADLGVSIPRTTDTQLAAAVAGTAGKVIGRDLSQAQQGDILQYTGHEEIWLNDGGNVFSEAVPGTVADVRPRTPWPIVGIVRYTDAPGSPFPGANASGTVGGPVGSLDDQINALPVIFDPIKPLLRGLMGPIVAFAGFITAIGKFLKEITDPKFWQRVFLGALGLLLLILGLYGMMKKKAVIQVTSQMIKKGADIASQP